MTTTAHKATLLFAGGGTGGHLYPAIAVANRITELVRGTREIDIHFVGTKRGIEYRIRETLGYPLHIVNVRGLVRTFTLRNLLVPFVLIGAVINAWRLLSRLKPNIVIGTGGYVALPVVKIAALRNIPTIIQEQNSFPGITTRKLAPRATHVFLGFSGAGSLISTSGGVTVCGNPVRRTVSEGDREEALRTFGLDPNKKTILIIGGSQGSRPVNRAILEHLRRTPLPQGYQLLWQTGKLDHEDVVRELGDHAGGKAVFPFSERMDLVYAAADIAIARAGALTIAELEACALPSILIPYPHAAGDHQRKNAEEYASYGGAVVVAQDELERINPITEAVTMLSDGSATRMKEAIAANRPEVPAVDVIAKHIIGMIQQAPTTGGDGDR
ncbi:undecaprenyldiphospho-muramoylpentapeptide beta-N-acetylglucosaminyltransferase [bacterium]|nr:undecaprenyldiphospho-muramoylpentapeptide beta-N-acetylglucosaminyltransferase [bacterium]